MDGSVELESNRDNGDKNAEKGSVSMDGMEEPNLLLGFIDLRFMRKWL
jgi:hypothetical protein